MCPSGARFDREVYCARQVFGLRARRKTVLRHYCCAFPELITQWHVQQLLPVTAAGPFRIRTGFPFQPQMSMRQPSKHNILCKFFRVNAKSCMALQAREVCRLRTFTIAGTSQERRGGTRISNKKGAVTRPSFSFPRPFPANAEKGVDLSSLPWASLPWDRAHPCRSA